MPVGELAAHNHSASINNVANHNHTAYGQSVRATDGSGYNSCNYVSGKTGDAGGHGHSITINTTGSNTAHNNIQPYLAVYYWKRTA